VRPEWPNAKIISKGKAGASDRSLLPDTRKKRIASAEQCSKWMII
jgi:hypothetical protein